MTVNPLVHSIGIVSDSGRFSMSIASLWQRIQDFVKVGTEPGAIHRLTRKKATLFKETMTQESDFLIIGGGIMGLSIARELRKHFHGSRVVLIKRKTTAVSMPAVATAAFCTPVFTTPPTA